MHVQTATFTIAATNNAVTICDEMITHPSEVFSGKVSATKVTPGKSGPGIRNTIAAAVMIVAPAVAASRHQIVVAISRRMTRQFDSVAVGVIRASRNASGHLTDRARRHQRSQLGGRRTMKACPRCRESASKPSGGASRAMAQIDVSVRQPSCVASPSSQHLTARRSPARPASGSLTSRQDDDAGLVRCSG
jgi:hypothetical protein